MNYRKAFSLFTLCGWATIFVILFMWSLTMHKAEANSLFYAAVNYDVGDLPRSVAIGDLNGDADLDLAVANLLSGNVSVLLGNGDGTFQNAVNYYAGSEPYSVAIGDLNGDNHPDLAVANGQGDNVSVFLGNGDGTFQNAVNYDAGDFSISVAIGNLNGDSHPDLAVANGGFGPGNVSVLLSNGDGTFQNAVNYYAGNWPRSVAIGDLNGDADLDLTVANWGSDNVSVLLGNGDGTFQNAVNYSAGDRPESVAIGDLNGDNHPDLAVAIRFDDNVAVLLGYGDGNFQSALYYDAGSEPYSVAIGDLNGDANLDLAVANNGASYVQIPGSMSVLLGNGDGSFQSALNYNADDAPYSVAIGDLNGDNHPDLAVANGGSDNVSILINTGGNDNQPPEAICQDVTVSTNIGSCSADASVDNGSFDPEGDPITFNQTPPGPYDLGDTEVTLTVTDDKGASAACDATVTVVDEEDPVISSVTANPNKLWPPNHKMVPVTVAVDATDNCDFACQIISVASNEPVNGLGDGDTGPDWEITGDLTVQLRAERSGKGNGRVYTITVGCADLSGNSSTDTATVTVPHDKGKNNSQNNKKRK